MAGQLHTGHVIMVTEIRHGSSYREGRYRLKKQRWLSTPSMHNGHTEIAMASIDRGETYVENNDGLQLTPGML
jgi:hypothetical protein